MIEAKTTSNSRKMRQELLNQLDLAGKNYSFYITLVDSYVRHYETLQALAQDIEERGTIVEITSGNGFSKITPNESIQLAQKEELSMIKILDALQLKNPTQPDAGENDYL